MLQTPVGKDLEASWKSSESSWKSLEEYRNPFGKISTLKLLSFPISATVQWLSSYRSFGWLLLLD